MKVSVDKETCIGSGNCEASCPNVFEVVDGVFNVKVNPVPVDEQDCAENAVSGCPTGAISSS
jgi:ferredoxin